MTPGTMEPESPFYNSELLKLHFCARILFVVTLLRNFVLLDFFVNMALFLKACSQSIVFA